MIVPNRRSQGTAANNENHIARPRSSRARKAEAKQMCAQRAFGFFDCELMSARHIRWQSKNPKARWAHICLASALRRGLIHRQPCRDCGDPKVDGHHYDYDRPLAIIWLCRRHHVQEHKRLRAKRGG